MHTCASGPHVCRVHGVTDLPVADDLIRDAVAACAVASAIDAAADLAGTEEARATADTAWISAYAAWIAICAAAAVAVDTARTVQVLIATARGAS
jgi:hypothetical protein